MVTLINWKLPVVDQDGKKWRVLCTDRNDANHPIIAMEEGGSLVSSFDVFGNGTYIRHVNWTPELRNAAEVGGHPDTAPACKSSALFTFAHWAMPNLFRKER